MLKYLTLLVFLTTVFLLSSIAHAYDEETTLPTNAWWQVDVAGAQYGLGDEHMAQVFVEDGEAVVRTVRPGDLVVHCHFPSGRIYKVLLHIYGDALDGSSLSANYQEECLMYVNQYRHAYGLPPLRLNANLSYFASIRAKETVDVYSHTRPNGSDCFTVIDDNFRAVGENIAKGIHSSKAVVDAWFDSPAHRDNILNPNFTEMGIFVYIDMMTRETMFWAQLFGGH